MSLNVKIGAAPFLVVSAFACARSPVGPTEHPQPLPITRFTSDEVSLTYSSGFLVPQQMVVRDAAAWRNAWAAIWQNVSTPPSLPNVDFDREMVVIAALGQRSTGGFSIFIAGATDERGTVRVKTRSVSPGPGCVTTAALTQPVDAARLPRRDRMVTFEDTAETLQCR